MHDLLLSKGGIALPQSHGLRQSIERHKGRLSSELTLARLKRKAPTLDALRDEVEAASAGEGAKYPRWVRVNALKSTVEDELETTFKDFAKTNSLGDVMTKNGRHVMVDPHVPGLLAVTQGTDLSKTEAYTAGRIILQDKASCFPAYLLDPRNEDGDVVDACAAPGNKTTHLAAILHAHKPEFVDLPQSIYAFEKDSKRAQTLEKMVKIAGSRKMTKIGPGHDFLRVDPRADKYKSVGALLLDPSCSGSGIVGRDDMPEVHLPEPPSAKPKGGEGQGAQKNKKRKHTEVEEPARNVMVDDDGNETVVGSEKDLKARLEALAGFQLAILLHAFKFPAATKVTYSTCSVHAEENEEVVLRALGSDIARQRGWRILKREDQVRGMAEWPVRGVAEACSGDEDVAQGCIRAYKDDGQGVMGFFVAGFVRSGDEADGYGGEAGDGPYLRDDDGLIMRDESGMPVLKSTGETISLSPREEEDDGAEESSDSESASDLSDSDADADVDGEEDEEDWQGFGD